MRSIIWLASYPKSGNTWVRFLLLNLLYGRQDTTENLESHIPDIHKSNGHIRLPVNGNILIKTHFMLADNMPLLDHTAGFIHIIRNPIDVMISNMNYAYMANRTPFDAAELEDFRNKYIARFTGNHGDPYWSSLGRGGMDEHISSWLDNKPNLPNLLLRYEDLMDDPLPQVKRLCQFLNIQKTDPEILCAVENSSFEHMKSIEEKELKGKLPGFFLDESNNHSLSKDRRFMVSGKSGEGKYQLNQLQMEQFMEVFGQIMQRLDYH